MLIAVAESSSFKSMLGALSEQSKLTGLAGLIDPAARASAIAKIVEEFTKEATEKEQAGRHTQHTVTNSIGAYTQDDGEESDAEADELMAGEMLIQMSGEMSDEGEVFGD